MKSTILSTFAAMTIALSSNAASATTLEQEVQSVVGEYLEGAALEISASIEASIRQTLADFDFKFEANQEDKPSDEGEEKDRNNDQ
ncbi:hypothetical protein [Algicola sagamiensis]|uniref:hypothetical protein n=1 Tax=Algicola sagamiensis TaxID=163869 RepID=UPI0003816DC8|nr:hypothetical protein [Algicola sagamiensis]